MCADICKMPRLIDLLRSPAMQVEPVLCLTMTLTDFPARYSKSSPLGYHWGSCPASADLL